ncbi:MAG: hypothetical protein KF784_00990 [Fimbriimonadaceae bacterium]|nr:hypothetical protein [Fimbriimonadaceae bacterium]
MVSVEGEKASSTGQVRGSGKRSLLTLIFMTPGATGNGSESSTDSGGLVAKFRLSNGLPPNKVDAAAEWDKKADVVAIEGKKYDRANGTLFVIVKSPGSAAKVWQLNPPEGITEEKKLLVYAKEELKDNSAVQSASLDAK